MAAEFSQLKELWRKKMKTNFTMRTLVSVSKYALSGGECPSI